MSFLHLNIYVYSLNLGVSMWRWLTEFNPDQGLIIVLDI